MGRDGDNTHECELGACTAGGKEVSRVCREKGVHTRTRIVNDVELT